MSSCRATNAKATQLGTELAMLRTDVEAALRARGVAGASSRETPTADEDLDAVVARSGPVKR